MAIFLLSAMIGGGANFLTSRLMDHQPQRYAMPAAPVAPSAENGLEDAPLSETAVRAFGHFGRGRGYPLALWEEDDALAGAVTHISIGGARPSTLTGRALTPADVLVVSGWAGEPLLGLPFTHVLFSLCGEVFAAADVREPRPDIRRFVHGNLSHAGWSTRLPVAAFPACPGAVADVPELLRVWAVRDQKILYPLEGVTALTLPRGQALASAVPEGRPPVRPETLPPLERRRVRVVEEGASLRQCPAFDCAALGRVGAGAQDAVLLDHAERWTLLVVDGQAGWLADDRFDVLAGEREDS